MNSKCFSNFLLLFFIILILITSCNNDKTLIADEFRVGVAKIDITPPLGYPVHGKKSEGILDTLFAKTIVFEQGNSRFVLIAADLFYIPLELSTIVRKIVSEKTGIDYANICLTATHTHNDPTCYDEIKDYVDTTKNKRNDNNSYAKSLIDKLVYSASKAYNNLQLATMESGSVDVDNMAFNRRHLLKDGVVKMNGGFLNPDILRAMGPVDPAFSFLLFKKEGDSIPFASLSTFAMQLATLGNEESVKFSGDFPHFLEKKLKSFFKDDYISIFCEGPSADVNHFDITKSGPQSGIEVTKKIGERLAYELNNSIKLSNNKINIKTESRIVDVPLQRYNEMDLQWANANKDSPCSFLVKSRIKKILTLKELREKYGEYLPLEIQVVRLSDETAVVMLPGQLFVELGMEIKKLSPFKTTIIITLSNNHEETIPLRKAYSEGGYEIIYSVIDSGGGEILVKTALDILQKMNE